LEKWSASADHPFSGGPLDDLIFDCYQLAEYYHINPDEFLRMPISRVQWHRLWTTKLIEKTRMDEDA
jgi:hypothetical protein